MTVRLHEAGESGIGGTGGRHRATRRRLVGGIIGVVAGPLALRAQPVSAMPRLGLLVSETRAGQASRIDALRAGLAEAGYVDGRTVAIEARFAEGRYDRLPALAGELVARKVDVIVAFGIKALTAASAATTSIPIVVPATSSDLVALGLVASLARPGGNVTGSTTFGSEIMVERLELVKEVRPQTTRVAVLVNPANGGFRPTFEHMKQAAVSLGFTLRTYDVRSRGDLEAAFTAMRRDRIEAAVIQDDTVFGEANVGAVVAMSSAQRLLAVGSREFAFAGGPFGYGRSDTDLYRRSARYVDRILKGAKPADLPIEQALRFDLVVNAKAANAMGLQVPQAVLLRADRVVD